MINPSKVIASAFEGFQNYTSVTATPIVFASQSIAANSVISGSSVTPLDNTNAISQIQVNYSGIETFWRPVFGLLSVDYPNWTSPNYQVQTITYYSGGNLNVLIYITNQTGSPFVIPAITVNIRAFLFKAPF